MDFIQKSYEQLKAAFDTQVVCLLLAKKKIQPKVIELLKKDGSFTEDELAKLTKSNFDNSMFARCGKGTQQALRNLHLELDQPRRGQVGFVYATQGLIDNEPKSQEEMAQGAYLFVRCQIDESYKTAYVKTSPTNSDLFNGLGIVIGITETNQPSLSAQQTWLRTMLSLVNRVTHENGSAENLELVKHPYSEIMTQTGKFEPSTFLIQGAGFIQQIQEQIIKNSNQKMKEKITKEQEEQRKQDAKPGWGISSLFSSSSSKAPAAKGTLVSVVDLSAMSSAASDDESSGHSPR
jgi:hypothetical protein